jgi:hypothetical protein
MHFSSFSILLLLPRFVCRAWSGKLCLDVLSLPIFSLHVIAWVLFFLPSSSMDRAACIHLEFLLVEYTHFLFNSPPPSIGAGALWVL